jgi:hypothetical protein
MYSFKDILAIARDYRAGAYDRYMSGGSMGDCGYDMAVAAMYRDAAQLGNPDLKGVFYRAAASGQRMAKNGQPLLN